MTNYILIIIALTFIIHFISTISYSVRIVGVRTGKIAVSFALFNILVLVSRLSNTIQSPLLAKHIENGLAQNCATINTATPFRLIMLSATLASIIGALCIPTFQRIFSSIVEKYSKEKSLFKVIMHSFSKIGIEPIKSSLKIPAAENIMNMQLERQLPWLSILLNIFAVMLLTIGVLSSLYAGYLYADLRLTCGFLSGIINGIATLFLFVLIDPRLSIMTDETVLGKCSQNIFRRTVVLMVLARILGTLLAQVFFIPAANFIGYIAKLI